MTQAYSRLQLRAQEHVKITLHEFFPVRRGNFTEKYNVNLKRRTFIPPGVTKFLHPYIFV